MVRPPLAPLRRIGKYDILRRLGEGGMAEIFLARALGLEGFEKLVVVKRLPPRALGNREMVEMFLHEARLAALLEHQNVVQVFDVGNVDDTYFFAMEFVHGQDARRIFKTARQRQLEIPLEVALTIVRDVTGGLHYAHEKLSLDGTPLGIIHRDVTPSNILVSYDGMVKLADFGIAKAATRQLETRVGMIKGKIAYMSPEQCQSKSLDQRSDIFSLGVVLWELTTGQKLYAGSSEYQIMHRIVQESALHPSKVKPDYPGPLAKIVLRCLDRDRDKRFATALELETEIEAFAVKRGLTLSSVRVARFMEILFAEEIGAWREAQQRGQGLIDYVSEAPAAAGPERGGRTGSPSSVTPMTDYLADPDAAAEPIAEDHPGRSARRERGGLALAIAAGVLVGGMVVIGLYLGVGRAGEAPAAITVPDPPRAALPEALPGDRGGGPEAPTGVAATQPASASAVLAGAPASAPESQPASDVTPAYEFPPDEVDDDEDPRAVKRPLRGAREPARRKGPKRHKPARAAAKIGAPTAKHPIPAPKPPSLPPKPPAHATKPPPSLPPPPPKPPSRPRPTWDPNSPVPP